MNKKERVFAIVGVVLLAAVLIAATRPHPQTVQAGTAVIYTGGSDTGFTYIDYSFPGNPVVVVTLATEVETQYLYARALSSVRGSIAVKLDAPTTQAIEVNWIATMATVTAGTEH